MPVSSLNKSFQSNPRLVSLGIYIGFVKRNDDAQRMGRLSVFIPELGGDPEDPGAWVIVGYASPFAGATDPTKIQPASQTMEGSQQSYGFWMIPPDLNNEVAVFFANNDISRGYWFACCFQQNMNHMIPGIATNVTTEPQPPIKMGPVVEYNKANVISTTAPRRPRFTPLSNGLATEGLTTDNERGSASTSARREAPSQVFGFLSPRGNTVHIDDNTTNEFIRLRTRSGAQILIHETTGYVYINSKLGNSWVEISDSGVDIYTANSISMRAEQDFNVRADGNINLDAGSSLNLRAGKNITIDAGGSLEMQATSKINLTADFNIELVTKGNILCVAALDLHMTSGQDMRTLVGNDSSVTVGANQEVVVGGSLNTQSVLDMTQLSTTGNLHVQSALDATMLSGGNLRLQSIADSSLLSGGNFYMQSTKDLTQKAGGNLRLQATLDMSLLALGSQIRSATLITDTPTAVEGGPAPPATAAPAAPPAPVPTPDVPNTITPPIIPIGLILGDARQSLIAPSAATTIWKSGAGQVNTIVTRMPTHEPWHEHPNGDVPPPPTEVIDIVSQPIVDAGIAGTVSTNSDGTVAPNATASNVNPDGTINDAGCTAGVSGTKPISTDVYNAIMNACTKTGADPACMLAFADIESSFQPGISAKGSSATGLYQFINSTWVSMVTKYGNKYNVGLSQINDAVGNALMGGQFICDNAAALKRQGITNPTPGQLYVVHFAGSGGGPAMILAAQKTPDASASLLFPSAASANPTIFSGKSISQVVAHLSSLADTKAQAYAGQYGLPAPCDRGTSGAVAVPLNPNQTADAALSAPTPINLHTQASGSVVIGPGTGVTPTPPTVMAVPVGGAGAVSSQSSVKTNANGYAGVTTQPASLLNSAGLQNPTQWSKGSNDPTTWAINQPIAIFGDNGQYGNSRAAIFLGLLKEGNSRYTGKPAFIVYDQAPGQPAQERIIYYDKNSNNAAIYSAINQSAPPQTPNAANAGRVKAACVENYRANVGNCSGFVNAVGKTLSVPVGGGLLANPMVTYLQSGMDGWTLINGPAAALASAQAGNFVVAGMMGSQQAHPDAHGHVVIIVDGPVAKGKYPTAYWGSLGALPGNGAFNSTINYAWLPADVDRIIYATHPLT